MYHSWKIYEYFLYVEFVYKIIYSGYDNEITLLQIFSWPTDHGCHENDLMRSTRTIVHTVIKVYRDVIYHCSVYLRAFN